jgi:hypothetical protein
MEKSAYPVRAIKESLKNLEREALRLGELSKGFPAMEKNLNPILTFIDMMKHHVNDLPEE